MAVKYVLFDLDDTLIVDEEISRETFDETAKFAAETHGVEPKAFATEIAHQARELWQSGPAVDYCRNIGISAFEGLWGNFQGEDESLQKLCAWIPSFRTSVFREALHTQGRSVSEEATNDLVDHWRNTRRKLLRVMPGAEEMLRELQSEYVFGLLTNGAPYFQREKFEASGLAGFFKEAVISGDHGFGKPKPEIFQLLLDRLGASPSEAIMVGNSLDRDVAGANHAGIASVWIHVHGSEGTYKVCPDHRIEQLSEMPILLANLKKQEGKNR